MAITEATLEAKIEEVVTAIEAGTYTVARQKLAAATAMLAALPDSELDGVKTNYGRRLKDLDSTLSDLAGSPGAAGGSAGSTRLIGRSC